MFNHIYSTVESILIDAKQDVIADFNILNFVDKYTDVSLMSYTKMAEINKITFDEILQSVSSQDGFMAYSNKKNKAYIFYNDKQYKPRIRFTIAHELYHYFAGHCDGSVNEEIEANRFAGLFLANPFELFMLSNSHSFKSYIDYSNAICSYFNISKSVAEISITNLESYLNGKTYNTVPQHPYPNLVQLSISVFSKKRIQSQKSNYIESKLTMNRGGDIAKKIVKDVEEYSKNR